VYSMDTGRGNSSEGGGGLDLVYLEERSALVVGRSNIKRIFKAPSAGRAHEELNPADLVRTTWFAGAPRGRGAVGEQRGVGAHAARDAQEAPPRPRGLRVPHRPQARRAGAPQPPPPPPCPLLLLLLLVPSSFAFSGRPIHPPPESIDLQCPRHARAGADTLVKCVGHTYFAPARRRLGTLKLLLAQRGTGRPLGARERVVAPRGDAACPISTG